METIATFDIPAGNGNCRNSEGSFLTLKNGRIIFAYSQYEEGTSNDHDHANIAFCHSDDDGDTWVHDGVVFNRGDAQNLMSVSLLRLDSGRIIILFLKKFVGQEGLMHCIPMRAFSDDEAQTWTTPEPCYQHLGYHVINNDRLVKLSSGRIAAPEALTPWFRRESGTGATPGITVFNYSDDGGVTWLQSLRMVYPVTAAGSYSGWQEPGVIELEPGKLMMWLRSDLGYQYLTYSNDNGASWSVPIAGLNFASPCSPMSMKRDPKDNSIIAIWDDQRPFYGVSLAGSTTPRRPLVVARSRDNGVVWREHQVIENEPNHGYCYTAIHFHKDRTLLAYCCGLASETHGLLQDLRIRVMK